MRKIALILAVLATAVAASPASASAVFDSIADRYYKAAVGTGTNQDNYCPRPRSNTTEICVQDFNKLYVKAMETVGWEVMYEKARLEKAPTGSVQFFWNGYDKSFKEMQAMLQRLRDLYYPVQSSATTGQRSGQPKVIRTGK